MDATRREAIFERAISNFCKLVNIHVTRWSERGLVKSVPDGKFYEALFNSDAGGLRGYCPGYPVAVGLTKELARCFDQNRVALGFLDYSTSFFGDFTTIGYGGLSPDGGKIRGFFTSGYTPAFYPYDRKRNKDGQRAPRQAEQPQPMFHPYRRKRAMEGAIIKEVNEGKGDFWKRQPKTRWADFATFGGIYGRAINGDGPEPVKVTARLLIVAKTLYDLLGELE